MLQDAEAGEMRVTPPHFTPVPFAPGTFRAFIKFKSLSPTQWTGFDMAVASPLAGLVFASIVRTFEKRL